MGMGMNHWEWDRMGLKVIPFPLINRWNRLDQQTVGASSLNVFKTRLIMIRNTRMGFFMD